ncbi:Gfo/Idh/MocA family protein [Plantactinospora sp. GCM10030261]|uniref:Gfo/Idh/MocA family protein n=1 Tax=Plantactinospora sp. GCM10030261 TaxID=3273420 RepID=UPI00362307A3
MRSRIGVVGAGGVAQRHVRVLSGFSDVELVCVTDVVPEASARLADTCGARAVPDVEAVLAAGVDAVYVCVPPFAHGPAEEAVLAAGLPMFVEKPVAVDLATAERVAATVAERGVLTAVGHHWRYLSVVEQARSILGDREVRMVNGWWLDKVPPVSWWVKRDMSGGPVIEQAAHVLDLMRLLTGEVAEVTAYGDGRPPAVDGADIDGVTAAALRFASGAVGTLGSACVLGWKQRAAVEILADGLALTVGEQELVVRDADGERTVPGDPDAARTAVDRAFVDAVRGLGHDIRVSYPEAVATHRVATAVAESAWTGRPVHLDRPEPAPAGPGVTSREAAEVTGREPVNVTGREPADG